MPNTIENANVAVVTAFGADNSLGRIPANIGMATHLGIITGFDVNGLCLVGSGSAETKVSEYDFHLQVTVAHAQNFWGWSSGSDVINYNHTTDLTASNDRFNPLNCSGTTFNTGNGTVTFGRN